MGSKDDNVAAVGEAWDSPPVKKKRIEKITSLSEDLDKAQQLFVSDASNSEQSDGANLDAMEEIVDELVATYCIV